MHLKPLCPPLIPQNLIPHCCQWHQVIRRFHRHHRRRPQLRPTHTVTSCLTDGAAKSILRQTNSKRQTIVWNIVINKHFAKQSVTSSKNLVMQTPVMFPHRRHHRPHRHLLPDTANINTSLRVLAFVPVSMPWSASGKSFLRWMRTMSAICSECESL